MSRVYLVRHGRQTVLSRIAHHGDVLFLPSSDASESPATLQQVAFDDEADVVLVSSSSEASLKVVQAYVSLLMSDDAFRAQCMQQAETGGYLE